MRPVDAPGPGWKVAKNVWMGIAGMVVCVIPVIAADAFVLTPMALTFLMGGAPLIERANAEARCGHCQYPIDRDISEKVRPTPYRTSAGTLANVRAATDRVLESAHPSAEGAEAESGVEREIKAECNE